jgi:hypothetical protein
LSTTPGTNAIVREHERLTTDFVPRADLVDKRREAELIADQARVAVAAAAGGVAVGLAIVVTVAASTVAADVTGLLLASVVLGIGFLIIPARRRRAKATLDEKVAALRHLRG